MQAPDAYTLAYTIRTFSHILLHFRVSLEKQRNILE